MIVITQGNTATLQLTATDGNGNPINLTGATFSTQINGPNGNFVVTFPNSQHTANPDQVDFEGQFTLALAISDTANLGTGFHKEIITTITIGSQVVSYRGPNILKVLPPTPYQ